MFFCFCFVLFDYPNMHLTEGSSFTRRVRDAGHASRRMERTQRMEEEGVVPSRRRGDRGRRANVESQPEPEHEQEHDDMDVQQQQMEEEEFQEELEAMDEDMEDEQLQRMQTKKKHVVDPEPLHDYPSGPHDTTPDNYKNHQDMLDHSGVVMAPYGEHREARLFERVNLFSGWLRYGDRTVTYMWSRFFVNLGGFRPYRDIPLRLHPLRLIWGRSHSAFSMLLILR
jgi:hypothetical protein